MLKICVSRTIRLARTKIRLYTVVWCVCDFECDVVYYVVCNVVMLCVMLCGDVVW